MGNQTVSEAYPELYDKVANRFMSVAEAGYWEGENWEWQWESWLSETKVEDEDLLSLLQQQLPRISRQNAVGSDEVVWIADENSGFSIKGCAKELSNHDCGMGLQSLKLRRISFVCKLKVPSKVGIFVGGTFWVDYQRNNY